jgi:hypothetical protein
MKLIQARLRGYGPIMASRWFDLSPRLNLLHYPDDGGRDLFLRTLATINPRSLCPDTSPFAELPPFIERQGLIARIHPEKRTVALATFGASADLVRELAAVSPHLYETDRIEVGRRLDSTRWINFVEVASSTRWSEIAEGLQQLMNLVKKDMPERTASLADSIASLQPSDRIKDGRDTILAEWLQTLPTALTGNSRQLVEDLLTAVLRAEHFRTARRIVEKRLPLFMVLQYAPGSSLLTLQDAALSVITFSRDTGRGKPVLLIDSPERFLPPANHGRLADFVLSIAESCQCLYAYAAVDIFPESRDITRYTCTDLTDAGHRDGRGPGNKV